MRLFFSPIYIRYYIKKRALMSHFSEILKENCIGIPYKYIEFVERSLLISYSYPTIRAYHNWKHIEDCLEELKQMEDTWEIPTIRNGIILALYYHDCVYEPLKDDNEERSAERAVIDLMALGMPEKFTNLVSDLIMLTKHTGEATDFPGEIVMDIDLAVLGKSSKIFRNYEDNIRVEYSGYSSRVYREGRIKVLEHFMNKPKIYQTMYFFKKYEDSARKNIEQSLKELKWYL